MYDSRINVAGWVLLVGLRCYRWPLPQPVIKVPSGPHDGG